MYCDIHVEATAYHKHGVPFDLVDEDFAVRIHLMLEIHLSTLFAFTPGRLRSVSLSRKRSGWKCNKKTLVMGLILRISYTAVLSPLPAGKASTVMQQQACLSSCINLGSVLRGGIVCQYSAFLIPQEDPMTSHLAKIWSKTWSYL